MNAVRFPESSWKVPAALLATSVLISIAGVANAQTIIFFRYDDDVDPESPNYDGFV